MGAPASNRLTANCRDSSDSRGTSMAKACALNSGPPPMSGGSDKETSARCTDTCGSRAIEVGPAITKLPPGVRLDLLHHWSRTKSTGAAISKKVRDPTSTQAIPTAGSRPMRAQPFAASLPRRWARSAASAARHRWRAASAASRFSALNDRSCAHPGEDHLIHFGLQRPATSLRQIVSSPRQRARRTGHFFGAA